MGALLFFSHDEHGNAPSEAARVASVVYGAPGAVLAAWGGYEWFGSTSAASNRVAEHSASVPALVPVRLADVVLPPGVVATPADPPR